jgi:hypothetical protein
VPKNRTSPAETAGLPQRLEVSIITGRSTTVENVRDPLCKLQQKRLFGVSQMDAEERANGMITAALVPRPVGSSTLLLVVLILLSVLQVACAPCVRITTCSFVGSLV